MSLPPDHPPVPARQVGVLLINLGTPDAPEARAVRRYLAEFLSDPRVVEIPAFAWKPILKGLNDRELNIAQSIATEEKVKLEMAQLKSENETLLAAARGERAQGVHEGTQIPPGITMPSPVHHHAGL